MQKFYSIQQELYYVEKVSKYDESIVRVEQIVKQLEEAQALSMEEYKRLATEATALLKQCKAEIQGFTEELNK